MGVSKPERTNFAPERTADGIWISSGRCRDLAKPALFLDRDGVLIEDKNYLADPDDVVLAEGGVALLRWVDARGIPAVVVSNQSGIARGLFGWPQFEAVERRIFDSLAAEGVGIDLSAACPFHSDHTPGFGSAQAYWRKPGPGMIRLAAAMLKLDLGASWLVGDKASDIAAAKAAGLAGAVHVLTGHGRSEREAALRLAADGFPVLAAAGLTGLPALFVERGFGNS